MRVFEKVEAYSIVRGREKKKKKKETCRAQPHNITPTLSQAHNEFRTKFGGKKILYLANRVVIKFERSDVIEM